MKTVFLRALEADDKAAALRAAIQEPEAARGRLCFEVDVASFAAVPRSPFAYWASNRLLRLFIDLPALEGEGRQARVTNPAGDDMRFFRAWWEPLPSLPTERAIWVLLNKGGSSASYYFDVHMVVRWDSCTRSYYGFLGTVHRPMARPASLEHFFRPGLTWPLRTQKGLALRATPAGCIFSHKGPTVCVERDSEERLLPLLAVTNSRSFCFLAQLQMAFGSYEVGVIQRTPIPNLNLSDQYALAMLARRAWSLKRRLDTRTEASHAFILPALLQVTENTLAARAVAWAEHVRAIEAELAAIQAEIDARCFDLYGIDEADRGAITEGFGSTTASAGTAETDTDADTESENEADDENEDETSADTTILAAELVSWAVGVAFGRFDVRLAIGSRVLPSEPEPFNPLPVCSSAMLTGEDGLPLASAPAGYPLTFPENGILVDDPGHPHDLTTAVRAVFDVVFGDRAETIWQEAAALLDPNGHDLRTWLSASFFVHHLKHHSKSRRKAPIFWQLGSPSGRYSVWLYAHRLTCDSFFQIQNDVVVPKLIHEERQLTRLIQTAGGSSSAVERKKIATQEAFVEELCGLLDEVKRVAPLWNPTLDDGVVLMMGPLWRLVLQHKPWQKEIKGKWDGLCAGKYDWSHLAMHLWPERMVSKCATDRSLAIAHELEDVFWIEDVNGKWQLRATPTRSVDELIHERTSSAVKAALTSLLDAPIAISGKSRERERSTGIVAAHEGAF